MFLLISQHNFYILWFLPDRAAICLTLQNIYLILQQKISFPKTNRCFIYKQALQRFKWAAQIKFNFDADKLCAISVQTVCKTILMYLFLSTLKKSSHTPIPTSMTFKWEPIRSNQVHIIFFVSQDMKMLEEANTAGLFVVCFAFRRLNTTQRGAN